jgi:hypothetical protein
MRFFENSDEPLSIKDVETAMKGEDAAYCFELFAALSMRRFRKGHA